MIRVGALAWVLLCCCIAAGAAEPMMDKADLFEAGKDGYALYRIPGIVVTPKGTVLAYCEARKNQGGDWGQIDIMLRRSTDGGKTWLARQHVAIPGQFERNPAAVKHKLGKEGEITFNNPITIVDHKTGAVHLLICVEYGRCFYLKSNDEGATFSMPVEITATFDEFKKDYPWRVLATGPGHGIQLKNGRLLVPVWLSTGDGGHAHRPSAVSVITSDDHGKTWQRGDIVVRDPELTNPSETAAVELADGRVMLNIRNEGKPHLRVVTFSADGATRWSPWKRDENLPEPICMASLVRYSGGGGGGKNRILFSNPNNPTSRERKNVSVRLSEDEGKTWPVVKSIEAGPSGYSDLAVGPDGTIYCFYERGALEKNAYRTRSLCVARFNLEWLTSAGAEQPFVLKGATRVLFLGDSNTFTGHFITYLDTYLTTRFPDKQCELINLGLPSETVSGLTEEDHPFPRPNVHDRAERALAKIRPQVVVICYGMNDGIYAPFSDERFAKYKEGIHSLLNKVTKAGATPVLMTPAPFDPIPVRKNLLPRSASKFSYMRPFEDYDNVLHRYSEWLVTLRAKGIPVADAHTAMRRFVDDVRKEKPGFSLSGDGIHPSPAGHALVARELLAALKAPTLADEAAIDAVAKTTLKGSLSDVTFSKERIRFTWKSRLPTPRDPAWQADLVNRIQYPDGVNRYELRVTGLEQDHELWEGKTKLATYSKHELAQGIDLTQLPELSTNKRAAEIGKLITQRHKLLDLAWLDHIGHTRPQTPKGLPLEDAQKKAAPLAARIRELAQPMTLTLELRAGP